MHCAALHYTTPPGNTNIARYQIDRMKYKPMSVYTAQVNNSEPTSEMDTN
jgi:hypothetical protein